MAEPDEIIKIVLDTTAILQAALDPNGPAASVIERLEDGEASGCVSGLLLQEYRDILNRPSLRAKYPRLTEERADAILKSLQRTTERIDITPSYVEYQRDPKDEPALNLAIALRADYLIARDRDLRDLDNDRDFRLLYPFVRIITPESFLSILRQRSEK